MSSNLLHTGRSRVAERRLWQRSRQPGDSRAPARSVASRHAAAGDRNVSTSASNEQGAKRCPRGDPAVLLRGPLGPALPRRCCGSRKIDAERACLRKRSRRDVLRTSDVSGGRRSGGAFWPRVMCPSDAAYCISVGAMPVDLAGRRSLEEMPARVQYAMLRRAGVFGCLSLCMQGSRS